MDASNEQSGSKKDGNAKQFRWTPPMDRLCLEILAKEAKMGNKCNKIFKKHSYKRVAKEVSEKFDVLCDVVNVENHLRTTKKKFNLIMELKRNSGFGWDDNLKMITADPQVYDDYIKVKPKCEPYLNKKINMYEEMMIVFGEDQTTESIAKACSDIDAEHTDLNAMDATSEQSGSKKDGNWKQFRWTPPMDRLCLEILAEEAKMGNKGSKTFKKCSYSRVAKEVSEKFDVTCNTLNVENHLRTTRKKFNVIMELKRNSEFGWDDNLKMITADPQVYNDYVKVKPNYEPYLNKKINMYEEMVVVLGEDQAMGSLSKTCVDIDVEYTVPNAHHNVMIEESIGIEETDDSTEYEKQVSSTGTSSQARRHGKRARATDVLCEKMDIIAKQIGEVAAALREAHRDITPLLYKEVMKFDGFEVSFLSLAFDYLVEHDKMARSFLAKDDSLRMMWLQKFHADTTGIGDSRGSGR